MSNDASKHDRSITLLCPTCGTTEFEYDDENDADDAPMKCTSCSLEITKAQLIESNQENITIHQNEIAQEIIKDFDKQIKNMFRGNKFIQIK
jgi:predicted RNA-binding Zn-ribbon protein involved in translation (DUF1610 family)